MKNRFMEAFKSMTRGGYRRAAAVAGMIVMISLLAYAAAQTPVIPVTPLGPYITGQPMASSLNFAFSACDASNGNSFPLTGREILVVENAGVGAYTFTISSVADQLGRTNDVTSYSLAAGDFAAFNFRGGVAGWKQADGTVHLTCSNVGIEYAILTTPY